MPSYLIIRESLVNTHTDFNRANVINSLLTQNYSRIHRNILVEPNRNKINDKAFFKKPHFLILKTSREIMKPQINEQNGKYDLGSLILVAYTLPEDVKIRKATNRLVRRTPCFKLARSIYLFPQIRYDNSENSLLIKPSTFLKKMIVFGIPITYAPKLILSDNSLTKSLINELKDSLNKRTQKILQDCNSLQSSPKFQLNKRLSEVRIESKIVRELVLFHEKELKIDMKNVKNALRRATKALITIRKKRDAL